MPLWAAATRITGIRNVGGVHSSSSSSSFVASTDSSDEDKKKYYAARPPPDPQEEAYRMASLKKLRHRLVQLCAEHGQNRKPPVMAFGTFVFSDTRFSGEDITEASGTHIHSAPLLLVPFHCIAVLCIPLSGLLLRRRTVAGPSIPPTRPAFYTKNVISIVRGGQRQRNLR